MRRPACSAMVFVLAAVGEFAWPQTPTDECGPPPASGGHITCNAGTYPLPPGAVNRGNISYFFEDDTSTTDDDDRDYVVEIVGGELGELRYLDSDTSIEPSKVAVVDVHGGANDDDDSLSDIDITLLAKNLTVTTTAAGRRGIFAVLGASSGDLRVDITGGNYTTADRAISAVHDGSGDLEIGAKGAAIRTTGDSGIGIDGWHDEFGNVMITIVDSEITTEGRTGYGSHGVRGYVRHNDAGDLPDQDNPGNVVITIDDTIILTKGLNSSGIYAVQRNQGGFDSEFPDSYGDIDIRLKNSSIRTGGPSDVELGGFSSHGIYASHRGIGDIRIDVTGGSIVTEEGGRAEFGGTEYDLFSHAIYALHSDQGSIDITVRDAVISARGAGGFGVVASGAATDGDGYARQTVNVHGSVSGTAGAVYLVGGGRVIVGPDGFIDGAASTGIAVLSEGDDALLSVALELGGKPVSELLRGRIINRNTNADSTPGRTILTVNGVLLFDGFDVEDATGASVPHGAYDIKGLKVTRDATDGSLNLRVDEFVYDESARGGVYEALPSLLLRLEDRGSSLRYVQPSAAWVRASGGRGVYVPADSTRGAEYDLDRFDVESHATLSLIEGMNASASLRHVLGTGHVASRAGGGTIKATGLGAAVDAGWQESRGPQIKGRASVTRYNTKISSADDGELITGVPSTSVSLGLETGWRFALNPGWAVLPHAWIHHSRLAMDGFTDTVRSRVTLPDGERSSVGAGVAVTAEFGGNQRAERTVSVRAFAGVEGALLEPLDDKTVIEVSGTRLSSKADPLRVLLGLEGAVITGEGAELRGGFQADGLGSGDRYLSGYLEVTLFDL